MTEVILDVDFGSLLWGYFVVWFLLALGEGGGCGLPGRQCFCTLLGWQTVIEMGKVKCQRGASGRSKGLPTTSRDGVLRDLEVWWKEGLLH